MSHKALIAIVGPSGSGKSTSLRNLDPSTTYILDGERKGFPFRSVEKFKDKILPFSNPTQYKAAFQKAINDITTELIVVESGTIAFFQIKLLCNSAYKGYDVWSSYSKMCKALINEAKNDKVVVVFTFLDELVEIPQPDGSELVKRMIGVEGKEVKKQGGIEPDFLAVLFTDVRKNKEGVIEHRFETNNDGVTTAKTPLDMFRERYIPNDLAAALKVMKEYYLA